MKINSTREIHFDPDLAEKLQELCEDLPQTRSGSGPSMQSVDKLCEEFNIDKQTVLFHISVTKRSLDLLRNKMALHFAIPLDKQLSLLKKGLDFHRGVTSPVFKGNPVSGPQSHLNGMQESENAVLPKRCYKHRKPMSDEQRRKISEAKIRSNQLKRQMKEETTEIY